MEAYYIINEVKGKTIGHYVTEEKEPETMIHEPGSDVYERADANETAVDAMGESDVRALAQALGHRTTDRNGNARDTQALRNALKQTHPDDFDAAMVTITPSAAYRPHMIALDVCNAVYDATDKVPGYAKARTRLGTLIRRQEAALGGRNSEGGWNFKDKAACDAYRRVLGFTMNTVTRQGAKTQDGLRWIITAHGLAEDAEATAIRGRRLELAHVWVLIYRVLGWMANQYELDESWEPGLILYDEIRRAANI